MEFMDGVSSALDKYQNANGFSEKSAAVAQIAAEIAVASLVTGTVRTSMSALRLGLAISGKIGLWESASWAAGVGAGWTAGAIIDWGNAQNFGGRAYDWAHPNPFNPTGSNPSPFVPTNKNYRLPRGYRPGSPSGSVGRSFGMAEDIRSPLIIDLNRDGVVETQLLANNNSFDHDGNQFAEQTGWVGQNDALVVWDRNGDGQIDPGAELFGNDIFIPFPNQTCTLLQGLALQQ